MPDSDAHWKVSFIYNILCQDKWKDGSKRFAWLMSRGWLAKQAGTSRRSRKGTGVAFSQYKSNKKLYKAWFPIVWFLSILLSLSELFLSWSIRNISMSFPPPITFDFVCQLWTTVNNYDILLMYDDYYFFFYYILAFICLLICKIYKARPRCRFLSRSRHFRLQIQQRNLSRFSTNYSRNSWSWPIL